jgi:3-isopropylmalate/(R)-2-methylmalate dehydratase large subunit
MTARTLFAKIWDATWSPIGDAPTCCVDRHLLHDLGGSRGLLDLTPRHQVWYT